ncbi:uncharacterized protein FA14DRAFT_154389 [Meira miltonrushii]|uniref:Secreted protein n=1 Tax=Meira miltonrushii TaxID=1280837 RepID=A0A316VHH9_9BASI|nr:uncharacterized protein FA14DRAFT_154389 [Meira miltonrushii]PWN34955.1 hypothetical protein FA14DRAFT_154389 [Meira miltonrushii]
MQALLDIFKFSLISIAIFVYAHPIPRQSGDQISAVRLGPTENVAEMIAMIPEPYMYTPHNEQIEGSIVITLPEVAFDQTKEELQFVKRARQHEPEAPQPVCPHCGGSGCSSCKSGSTRNHLMNHEIFANHYQDSKMHLSRHLSEHSPQNRGIEGSPFGSGAHEKQRGAKD